MAMGFLNDESLINAKCKPGKRMPKDRFQMWA